jgi:ferric-dicitrate binding protein FerR (iron transport regulator)
MENKSTIDDHLLLSYLKNEADDAQVKQVQTWLSADVQNATDFEKLKNAWQHAGAMADFAAIDVNNNWLQVKAKLVRPKAKQFYLSTKIWRVAAAIILIATFIFLGNQYLNNTVGEMMTVTSAELNNEPLLLSDGSKVWLKEGSLLNFPSEFSSEERRVDLIGEALFEVTHNPRQPFIVQAKETETKVLGTSFNLNASHEGEKIELVLITGQVRFSTKEEVVLLSPGDQVMINKEGKLTKKENTNPNYLAWKTGSLVFENTTMGKVMADIANAYNIKYKFENEAFMSCPLTTRFDGESLEYVIETLEAVFDVDITLNEDVYLIKGNGC